MAASPLALGLLLLAGCSSQQASAQEPDPEPVSAATAAVLPRDGDAKKLEVVAGQPIHTASQKWDTVGATPQASKLDVAWVEATTPQCGQVTSARLHETADSIVVQLLLVAAPASAGHVCDLSGSDRKASIPLSSPIGTRQVLEPCTPPPATSDALSMTCQ